ncbi:hypothetical protein Aph02nite_03250 [Actinoplanes philippinensis]|nr:hypothetical protein Aph02nite_03250 [Actinoplanes philippinensis]
MPRGAARPLPQTDPGSRSLPHFPATVTDLAVAVWHGDRTTAATLTKGGTPSPRTDRLRSSRGGDLTEATLRRTRECWAAADGTVASRGDIPYEDGPPIPATADNRPAESQNADARSNSVRTPWAVPGRPRAPAAENCRPVES